MKKLNIIKQLEKEVNKTLSESKEFKEFKKNVVKK